MTTLSSYYGLRYLIEYSKLQIRSDRIALLDSIKKVESEFG